MSFTSGVFFLFVAALLLVYFLIPRKYQWLCLLVGSYVFYAYANLKVLHYIVITTIVSFFCAIWIEKLQKKCGDEIESADHVLKADEKRTIREKWTVKKRRVLAVAVVIDLGLLIFIKYSNFVIGSINDILITCGVGSTIPALKLLVPLGISFYTFQTIGYLMDVYRGRVAADRHFLKFALFVSYFPQIVQGPIGRYGHLAEQLTAEHPFEYTRFKFGLQRMMWGYFKKMVIADRIAVVVNEVFGNYASSGYEGFVIWVAGALYSIQVYADFTSGMDIVIGLSEILGIRMTENFKRPFVAKSVTEFWQRWHITLGSWMKDYVFYPLALSKPLNRMGKFLRKHTNNYIAKVVPACLASFVVFVLVGVWHGADWKYVIYGIYQAIFVSSATLLDAFYANMRRKLHVNEKSFGFSLFRMLRTFGLLMIGRFLSRAATLGDAFGMLKAGISSFNPWVLFDGSLYKLGLNPENFRLMIILIVMLFIIDAMQEKGMKIRESISQQGIVFRWAIYYICLFGILVLGMYGPGYNAASFIYQAF